MSSAEPGMPDNKFSPGFLICLKKLFRLAHFFLIFMQGRLYETKTGKFI
jgi:hypothetical protein